MDLIRTEEIASVVMFDVRISESELQLLADSLSYLLRTLNNQQLNNVFAPEEEGTLMGSLAETRLFVEDRYREIMALIKEKCREEYLPPRFKNWEEP